MAARTPALNQKKWPPKAVLTLESQDYLTVVVSTVGTVAGATGNPRRNAIPSRLASWSLNWGDGTTVSGLGAPPATLTRTYAGDHTSASILLTVVDASTGSASDSVNVDGLATSPPNQPPRGVLSLVQAQYVSTPVIVSTAGSADPDGDLASGSITWGDGTTPTTWTGAPQTDYTHTYTGAATYTVTLTLVDDAGLESATAQIVVVVLADPIPPPDPPDPFPPPNPLPDNVPPISVLTYVAGQFFGQPYTFSTAGTRDTDGTLVSGSISWGDSTPNTTWTTSLPALLTHTYAAAGSYLVTYLVTDDGTPGLTSTITRQVVIQAPPVVVQPPVAVMDYISGVYVGDTVLFAVTGSSPDGLGVTWSINWGDGSSALTGTGVLDGTRTHVYTTAGFFIPTLSVTDSAGVLRQDTAPVTIATVPVQPPSGGTPHAYFEMLKLGPLGSTVMQSISLRATSGPNSPNAYFETTYALDDVSYVYATDPYADKQDGAKIHLRVFRPLSPTDYVTAQLNGGIGAGDASMVLNTLANDFDRHNLNWMIDSEIVGTTFPTGLTVPLIGRGLFGTTAAAHANGAFVRPVRHSSLEQCHVPIVLGDGYDHFFTFDYWFGPETTYALQGHSNAAAKSYRFEWPSPFGTVYLQGSHGAYLSQSPAVDCGLYEFWWGGLQNYPNAPTKDKPMSPYNTRPTVIPSRWVRHFLLFKQRGGAVGLDQFWSWYADELSGPIVTHNGNLISTEMYGATSGLLRLIEFHSSADGRIDQVANTNVIPPDRVWYARNFVHLRFAPDTDISSLLVRPE